MILKDTTIETLKNFSQINSGVVLQPGKFQKTINKEEVIMSEVTLEDEIPSRAGLYNLPEFLGLLSMLGNPDIEFGEDFLTLNDGEMTTTYYLSSPDLIKTTDNSVTVDDPDAKFVLQDKQMAKLLKVARALGLPDLVVRGGPDGIWIKVDNKENPISNSAELQLSKDATATEFEASWKVENLLLIPGNYNVLLSLSGVSIFENETQTRKYAISLQA